MTQQLIKTPIVPIRNLTFSQDGNLSFEALMDCAYDSFLKAFVGGKFRTVKFTHEGNPAWIRFTDGKLIIERLENYLVDLSTGNFVGGEMKTLLELNIS